MNILIAWILGYLSSQPSSNKINVSAVGCNSIVHDLKMEQYYTFIIVVAVIFLFFACFMMILGLYSSAQRNLLYWHMGV